jgi:RNA polymerase sigma factor (sigma-70 family)
VTHDQAEQNQRLSLAFDLERRRLLVYIRRHIPDQIDAEDLLQDVFCELVEAYRTMKPVAHAGAWMMQVAKNRLTDLFRRGNRKVVEDTGKRILLDLLPSPNGGPDALFAREVLIAEIEAALGELPPSQRQVFLAHEVDRRSFSDISRETGVSVKTLLSRKPRKHYAVKRLRKRLQRIYEESSYEGKANEETAAGWNAGCPVWDCLARNHGASNHEPMERVHASNSSGSRDQLLESISAVLAEPSAVREIYWRKLDAQEPLCQGLEGTDTGGTRAFQTSYGTAPPRRASATVRWRRKYEQQRACKLAAQNRDADDEVFNLGRCLLAKYA